MKIAGRELLDAFCAKHTDAKNWIGNWVEQAEQAAWQAPQDIKSRFATASFLGKNLVIFNVKGNEYRLEVMCAYRSGVLVIKWIGTHAAYTDRNKKR